MRFLVAGLVIAAMVVPAVAHAVPFPVKCKDVTTTQVKATRISVTKETGCKSGRLTVHHWIVAGFTSKHVGAYFCTFDTHGKHTRRARCIAGKNGGVAFTLTERTPA